MLDLAALDATRPQAMPFTWARVDGSFVGDTGPSLAASFPTEAFWRIDGDTADKRFSYAARPLVTLGGHRATGLPPLPPAWEALVDQLLSDAYRDGLSRLTGLDLSDALVEVAAWRWDEADQMGPHRDLPDKLVTHVLYLEPTWDPSWGGCLRLLGSRDPDDVVAEVPPTIGTASVLVRSETSWHEVSPVVAAAGPRRNVIVTWHRPGSASPVWRRGRDGRVRCVAGVPESDSRLGRAARRVLRRR